MIARHTHQGLELLLIMLTGCQPSIYYLQCHPEQVSGRSLNNNWLVQFHLKLNVFLTLSIYRWRYTCVSGDGLLSPAEGKRAPFLLSMAWGCYS